MMFQDWREVFPFLDENEPAYKGIVTSLRHLVSRVALNLCGLRAKGIVQQSVTVINLNWMSIYGSYSSRSQ